MTVVYIHPKADAVSAASTIFEVVQKLQSISPEAPSLLLGDFNHVSLKKTLPHYYQYVTCPTRRNKTLDLCYGTVKDTFKSLPLPPLGSADHNCVFLLPTYRTVLRREKVQTKDVKVWTEDSVLCLQECYNCTDWNMFRESCDDDLDELTDVTCSYVSFCRDMIIPSKTVKIYPNNKPWVTKSVKSSIEYKRRVFKLDEFTDLHKQAATRGLKVEILKAKKNYKVRLESQMADNKLGSAWSSMKAILGYGCSKPNNYVILDGYNSKFEFANALNMFYNRFDTSVFSEELQDLRHKLEDTQHFCIDQKKVEKAFSSVRVNKSYGPDNICGP